MPEDTALGDLGWFLTSIDDPNLARYLTGYMFAFLRVILILFIGLSLSPRATGAKTLSLAERLSGRILLQVQNRGEGWYVDPVSKQRFYLGTAADAFALLRSKGLGIRHDDFVRFQANPQFPARLSGRILLDVEDRGQAYYILPTSMQALRLGNAEETYQVLRQAGLGIRNEDLQKIPVAPVLVPTRSRTSPPPPSLPTPSSASAPFADLEQQTFAAINQHRQSAGLSPLIWNEHVAQAARDHSQNMARERVPFGHDGFDERFDQIHAQVRLSQMAENVASNTYVDTVHVAVQSWLHSPGHRTNIENGVYTHTGVGIAQSDLDEIFLTQLFVTLQTR